MKSSMNCSSAICSGGVVSAGEVTVIVKLDSTELLKSKSTAKQVTVCVPTEKYLPISSKGDDCPLATNTSAVAACPAPLSQLQFIERIPSVSYAVTLNVTPWKVPVELVSVPLEPLEVEIVMSAGIVTTGGADTGVSSIIVIVKLWDDPAALQITVCVPTEKYLEISADP